VENDQLEGVPDIMHLNIICQGAVLKTTEVRYNRNDIYTGLGKILIALNPFQRLDIYGKEYMKKYLDPKAANLEPHCYRLGRDAVDALKQRKKKGQAVLVSGESGAGKTETVKLILNYVGSALSPSQQVGVRYSMDRRGSRYSVAGESATPDLNDQIMQTNPVLESFGNAKTCRNDNSSRFGKWMQIAVNDNFTIKACFVVDYVLELTRVCGRDERNERNYHIFYQLVEHREKEKLKPLKIQPAKSYNYLQGLDKVPQVNDDQNQGELLDAFDKLKFSPALQTEIFKVVVGILNLGNMKFKAVDADSCKLEDEGTLDPAAEMLGVDREKLKNSLLQARMTVAGQVIDKSCNVTQSTARRDAVSRLIYGNTFKWLIEKINTVLSGGMSSDQAAQMEFFGMLDMAGFESLAKNSLEQMFINLCNEKLQRHFNAFFFDMELEHYRHEGLDVDASDFSFKDNQPIIDMIHGNATKSPKEAGILGILDEELKVAKATDLTFVGKVNKTYTKSNCFVENKFGKCLFTVRHFAGDVEYDCEGFMAKNDDKLPNETIEYLQSSTISVLSEIGNKLAEQAEGAPAAGGKKKANTVCTRFRESLAELMAKLDEAQPHFVRCIKPNQERVKSKFTSKVVMDQLLYSGVMELINIHCSGFPEQHTFEEVKHHYDPLLEAGAGDPRAEAYMNGLKKMLLESLGESPNMTAQDVEHGVKIGKTMVFMSLKVKTALERMRHKILAERHQNEQEAVEKLTSAIRAKDVGALESAIAFCETMRGKKFEPPELSEARDALEFQKKFVAWLSGLKKITADRDKAKLRECLDEAAEQDVEDLPEVVQAKRVYVAIDLDDVLVPPHKASHLREVLNAAAKVGLTGDSVEKAKEALKVVEARDKELEGTRQHIAQAVASRDLDKVADALKAGQDVGLESDELQELEALHAELQKEAAEKAAREAAEKAARGALKAAASDGDVEKLRAAVAEGQAAGLPESDADMATAKSAIARIIKLEEDRREAREALQTATQGVDIDALRQAVTRARQLGVDEQLIEEAEQKIKAEMDRKRARSALKTALDGRSPADLAKAIEDGEKCGIPDEELQAARVILPVRSAVIAQRTSPTAESREALRECLGEASGAPDCGELQDARAMLADLDRKVAAAEQMRAALGLPPDDPTRIKAIRAALKEAEACGLNDPELLAAAKELEQEAVRDEVRDSIQEGKSRRNTLLLREAVCKGAKVNLPQNELEDVQAVITQVYTERSELREAFHQALKRDDLELQASLFKQAEEIDAFTLEQHEKAKKDMDKSRARNVYIQEVQEAVVKGEIDGLRAALEKADKAGCLSPQLDEARSLVDFMERAARAEDKLNKAYASSDHTAVLKQSWAEKELKDAGLDQFTIRDKLKPLKAARAKKFRQLMLMEYSEVDIGDVAKAVIEGQAAEMDAHEIIELKRLFWQKYEAAAEEENARFEAMKDDMLSEQTQLALDVLMHSLRVKAEGPGTSRAKSSLATLCDIETGKQLVALLQEAWANKQGTILDELESLRYCVMGDDGTAAGMKPWDRKVMLKTVVELKQRYDNTVENATALQFPLAMLCMLLYTQHEADVDRMLLFPDCPVVVQPEPLRDAAYSAYREHLQRSRNAQRNACPDVSPCLAGRVTAALGGCLDELSRGATAEGLQKAAAALEEAPVKLMCGVSRLKETFEPPRLVSRWFPDLGRRVLEMLQKCSPGDQLVWVEPGSVTLNNDLSIDLARMSDVQERGVLLEIDGVTEGLELADVSQYPDEQEFLLPVGTVLKVNQVEKTSGGWLHLQCSQEPSLVQKPFEDVCWADLVLASSGLSVGLQAEEPELEADELEAPGPEPEVADVVVVNGVTEPGAVPLKQHRHIVRTLNHAFKPFRRRIPVKDPKVGDPVEALCSGEWRHGTVEKVVQARPAGCGYGLRQDVEQGQVVVKFARADPTASKADDASQFTKAMDLDKVWMKSEPQYRKFGGKPVKDVKSFFNALDADKSGALDVDELLNGFTRLGISTRSDKEAVVSFLRQLDEDGDGCIQLAELEAGLKEQRPGKRQPRQGSTGNGILRSSQRSPLEEGRSQAGEAPSTLATPRVVSARGPPQTPRVVSARGAPSAAATPRSPRAQASSGGEHLPDVKVKSLMSVFRALDRRGICAISHEDFTWAVTQFSDQKDFQKVIRTPAVCKHFFTNRYDLTLHRFLWLASPAGSDINYMLRRARQELKEELGKSARSPGQKTSPQAGRAGFRWPSREDA